MSSPIDRAQILFMVNEAAQNLSHEPCRTCDCFQGFLTQMELDSSDDVSDLTGPHKVSVGQMHGCLGCDPCPPGAAFADYLRRKHQESQ